MIKNLKMGIQLMRYGYGLKSICIMSVVFFLMGTIMVFLSIDSTFLGAYVIMAMAMCPGQMLYSVLAVDVVQSSPWKKQMQTKVMLAVNGISFFVADVWAFILSLIILWRNPADTAWASAIMLFAGIAAAPIMVYLAAALKLFKLSTGMFILLVVSNGWIQMKILEMQVSFPMAVLLNVLMLLIGLVLHYGVSCLLYRKPVSKDSQMAGLKKLM